MTLAFALFFLAFSAYIAGTETAFFHLSTEEKKDLAEHDSAEAKRVTALLSSPRQLLLSLLICNEASNLAFATCSALYLRTQFGFEYPWLNFLLAVVAILIFAETVPKSLAMRRASSFAKGSSRLLFALHILLTPLRWSLMQVASRLLTAFGTSPWGLPSQIEEEEIKHLVALGEKAGTIDKGERELIHNVFEFGDTVVSRLMTPRTDMVAFSVQASVDEILDGLRTSRLARVPIYDNSPDTIIGILYTKDLLSLRLTQHSEDDRPVLSSELLRPARFVPETMKADRLFRELQESGVHLAIVLDEYGGVNGLITMDDLLGELFGEILDEGESVDPPAVRALAGGYYEVLGSAEIEELNDHLGAKIPQSDEYSTVAGFLLTHLGRLPAPGAEIQCEGLRFVVAEVTDSRVIRLRVNLVNRGIT